MCIECSSILIRNEILVRLSLCKHVRQHLTVVVGISLCETLTQLGNHVNYLSTLFGLDLSGSIVTHHIESREQCLCLVDVEVHDFHSVLIGQLFSFLRIRGDSLLQLNLVIRPVSSQDSILKGSDAVGQLFWACIAIIIQCLSCIDSSLQSVL